MGANTHLIVLLALIIVTVAGCVETDDTAYHTVEQEIRPTEGEGYIGNGYGDVPVSSFSSEGGHFKVWWAESGEHKPSLRDVDPENGVPDYVETVAQTADRVAARLEELGFDQALRDDVYNDGGDFGDDERYDIYLVNTHGGDGYVVTEGCVEGVVIRCSGYIALENDFYGYGYPSVSGAVEILISHEYIHAVQNSYNAEVPGWWSEGTATWFEELFNPDQEDFERLASLYFDEPGRSLNSRIIGPMDSYSYGTSIFPYFIAETHGPEAILGVFERSVVGIELERYIDEELTYQGSSLAEAFEHFSVWNLFTGDRATAEAGYPVAEELPEMPLVDLDGTQPLNWDMELDPLAAAYGELTFDAAITLELRAIDDWENALSVAVAEPEAFAESGAYSVLGLDTSVLRLEPDTSPVYVVLTNGNWEDRAAARLAIRIATEEPDEPDEPEPAPIVTEELPNEDGCSVAGRAGSTWMVFAVFLSLALVSRRVSAAL